MRMLVYSKKCTRCDIAVAMGKEPMKHEYCPHNYLTESSKAMKSSDVLDLTKDLNTLGIGVELLLLMMISLCVHTFIMLVTKEMLNCPFISTSLNSCMICLTV